MEKFAGYGFNSSHSAAYALLTYQTAYLKRYYPVEFFAALLTCDKDDTDAVVKFIAEAKANGIAVLRPDVNESGTDFSVVKVGENGSAKKVIRFGLRRREGRRRGRGGGRQGRARAGRAVPVAVRFLQARRRAQGEPQGDRSAGQGGGVRRPAPSRAMSRARACMRPSSWPASAPPRRSASAIAARSTCCRCSPARAAANGPGVDGRGEVPDRRPSGCPRSCSQTKRRRSVSTSAVTRWSVTPARSAASRPRPAPTAWRRANARR